MFKRFSLGLSLLLLAASATAFDLVDSKGKHHKLSEYKGKWVLVNFWATWCPPCLEEIPDLVALHDNKKNKLVVLGIAMDYRDPKEVLKFAEQQMISYPVILGDQDVANQVGRLTGLPTTYLYNPQGKQVAYNVGALSRDTVLAYISNKGATTGKSVGK